MKVVAISGSKRENVGKRDAKELRYDGKVPAVLYGGDQQYHFSFNAPEIKDAIYTPEAAFVQISLDGNTYKAIIKDSQYHPLTDKLLHVDFLQLFDDKEIVMEIPVKLMGTSEGVRAGGKLVQKLRKLRVKALPENMPQNVEINIANLKVGGMIRVRDYKGENHVVTNAGDDTIVSVIMSRALKQAETEAAKGK